LGVLNELKQDPQYFHFTAEETPAKGTILVKDWIVIVDKRDIHPIRVNRGIVQTDWIDAFRPE
jgi:hypothetical protein